MKISISKSEISTTALESFRTEKLDELYRMAHATNDMKVYGELMEQRDFLKVFDYEDLGRMFLNKMLYEAYSNVMESPINVVGTSVTLSVQTELKHSTEPSSEMFFETTEVFINHLNSLIDINFSEKEAAQQHHLVKSIKRDAFALTEYSYYPDAIEYELNTATHVFTVRFKCEGEL